MNTVLSRPKKGQARLKALKQYLDPLLIQHKTPAFLQADPISLPHRYKHDPRACEAVGLMAALFSYGRRDKIIETVEKILAPMDGDPMGFIQNFQVKAEGKHYKSFVYRFNKGRDVVFLLSRLQWAYQEYGTLENLFLENPGPLKPKMTHFVDNLLGPNPLDSYGLKFLLPHPGRGGGCKRLQMYLRWMVRQETDSETHPIDLGLWRQGLKPRDLLIPLDTHVMQMNQVFQFSPRQSNTWETAVEITDTLRQLCPEDPVKYDFALMGLSLTEPDKQALAAKLPVSLSR